MSQGKGRPEEKERDRWGMAGWWSSQPEGAQRLLRLPVTWVSWHLNTVRIVICSHGSQITITGVTIMKKLEKNCKNY